MNGGVGTSASLWMNLFPAIEGALQKEDEREKTKMVGVEFMITRLI